MSRKQLWIAAAIFVTIITILIAGYLAFLRPNYITLFDNVREADASAIIAVLDEENISYKLQDQGRKISVPEDDISQAKIVVAASPAAAGSVVGFELFNESDMGLTDFAQKINFQRALQGELARTIMSMDGIEYSRVHLSIPERSLFRADEMPPKAAVTIRMIGSQSLSAKKVSGLQRLISSAVPNLSMENVVILDKTGGQLNRVNPTVIAKNDVLDEHEALETYYRARGTKAIKSILPSLNFQLNIVADKRVATSQVSEAPTANGTEDGNEGDSSDTRQDINRDFNLTAVVKTESALNQDDNEFVRNALVEALALQLDSNDTVAFETGALSVNQAKNIDFNSENPRSETSQINHRETSSISSINWPDVIFSKWFLLFLAIIVLICSLYFRKRSQLSEEDHQSFADQLNEIMNNRETHQNV